MSISYHYKVKWMVFPNFFLLAPFPELRERGRISLTWILRVINLLSNCYYFANFHKFYVTFCWLRLSRPKNDIFYNFRDSELWIFLSISHKICEYLQSHSNCYVIWQQIFLKMAHFKVSPMWNEGFWQFQKGKIRVLVEFGKLKWQLWPEMTRHFHEIAQLAKIWQTLLRNSLCCTFNVLISKFSWRFTRFQQQKYRILEIWLSKLDDNLVREATTLFICLLLFSCSRRQSSQSNMNNYAM